MHLLTAFIGRSRTARPTLVYYLEALAVTSCSDGWMIKVIHDGGVYYVKNSDKNRQIKKGDFIKVYPYRCDGKKDGLPNGLRLLDS